MNYNNNNYYLCRISKIIIAVENITLNLYNNAVKTKVAIIDRVGNSNYIDGVVTKWSTKIRNYLGSFS